MNTFAAYASTTATDSGYPLRDFSALNVCSRITAKATFCAPHREANRREVYVATVYKEEVAAMAEFAKITPQNADRLLMADHFPARQAFAVPINTFSPKPFEITTPIMVLVEPVVDKDEEPCEYIATFPDGSISVTGDTVEEAMFLLKDRMVAQYNRLSRVPPDRLGKIPQQQLDALRAVMRRVE
jgi:hypothetical protein